MERQFHNEDFEKFLKDNANQYRMYPSDKVWKGIYSALHIRHRWYAFAALILLLTSGALITFFALNNNGEKAPVAANEIKTVQPTPGTDNKINQDVSGNTGLVTDYNTKQKSPDALVKLRVPGQNDPVTQQLYSPALVEKSYHSSDLRFPQIILPTLVTTENNLAAYMEKYKIEGLSKTQNDYQITSNAQEEIKAEPSLSDKIVLDKKAENKMNQAAMALASNNTPIKTTRRTPRLTSQLYFTPTISYRKLSENKSYSSSVVGQIQPFNYNQFIDINKKVKHKPAMGVELGLDNKYALNNKIAAKAGLQFNISRYDIGAYFHPTEFATIALTSGNGADSITALSNYRNSNSYSPNWLENFYFQVSLPVGAEIILFGNKKAQWGVAGTIQPTYNLGERAYLITSDYKNYVKVPRLMRAWNLNTGVETFVSYSTGRIKWQVGPQVRYQHMSSFESDYPVKENLFNVGLKVGAKINKK